MPTGIYKRMKQRKSWKVKNTSNYKGKVKSSQGFQKGNKICLGRKSSEETKRKMSEFHKGITGENHPHWKGGKQSYYRNIACQVYREFYLYVICENCGSSENICIHHKDENIKNNYISNLQPLCRPCHLSIHNKLRKEQRKIIC